jgi:hypothetical protein
LGSGVGDTVSGMVYFGSTNGHDVKQERWRYDGTVDEKVQWNSSGKNLCRISLGVLRTKDAYRNRKTSIKLKSVHVLMTKTWNCCLVYT